MSGLSPPIMSAELDLLIRLLPRKRAQRDPYVLLLGSGASLSSDCSSTTAIVDDIAGNAGREEFDSIWNSLGNDEKRSLLKPHVGAIEPSPGYRCLAELMKAGYFHFVFSTNFDSALEDSLADARLRRRDYIILINDGTEATARSIAEQLECAFPPIKIVKLHGDFHGGHFAFSDAEIFQFKKPLEDVLKRYFSKSVIVVGHSMRDMDINRTIESGGSSIWYVNPSPPADDVLQAMKARGCAQNYITGEEGTFDRFFQMACEALIETRHNEVNEQIIAVEHKRLLHVLRFRVESIAHLFIDTSHRVWEPHTGPVELLRVPVVGTISASFCRFHDPSDWTFLYLPRGLVGKGGRALKVEGDSMIAKGIHDGDWVVIVPSDRADIPVVGADHSNRQTWAVTVSGETQEDMIKEIYRSSANSVELRPANKSLDRIVIIGNDAELLLNGKVVAVIHQPSCSGLNQCFYRIEPPV